MLFNSLEFLLFLPLVWRDMSGLKATIGLEPNHLTTTMTTTTSWARVLNNTPSGWSPKSKRGQNLSANFTKVRSAHHHRVAVLDELPFGAIGHGNRL